MLNCCVDRELSQRLINLPSMKLNLKVAVMLKMKTEKEKMGKYKLGRNGSFLLLRLRLGTCGELLRIPVLVREFSHSVALSMSSLLLGS